MATMDLRGGGQQEVKALPLPAWVVRFFYLFALVLYVPDAIFNYYVYSDGASNPSGNPILQVLTYGLWFFLSVGIVGMAYFCAILAPYHWSRDARLRSFFCWVGLLVATMVTMWNSLAFRSRTFHAFPTDKILTASFPFLAQLNLSPTMFIVSLMPPFWGLFWALVQPARNGRTMAELQLSFEEQRLRVEQAAAMKTLKAGANAEVRAAQLRGMAQTAAAARDQFAGLRHRANADNADNADDKQSPAESGIHAVPDRLPEEEERGEIGDTRAMMALSRAATQSLASHPASSSGRTPRPRTPRATHPQPATMTPRVLSPRDSHGDLRARIGANSGRG